MSRVLVIGAYGGEHVGDAAILGGVLLRSNREYGFTQFDLLSFRKDRTEFWVSNLVLLDGYVINVIDLQEFIKTTDFIYDYVIYAGGPIMELPLILSKYLYIVKRVKRNGGQFIIEGCGYGPFKTEIGKRVANSLVKLASRVTARTENAYNKFSAVNKSVLKSYDPAFDYLNLVKSVCPIADVNNNIRNKTIGINLRPTWNKYILSDGNVKINSIDSFLVNFFVNIIKNYPNHNFRLLSLNSDQFGFSDLNLLSRIKFEFLYEDRVTLVESEFTIDELCYNLDLCGSFISMRFHGCIFGLSRNCKVYGIDYTLGGKGKVDELLTEFGSHDSSVINLARILDGSIQEIEL